MTIVAHTQNGNEITIPIDYDRIRSRGMVKSCG